MKWKCSDSSDSDSIAVMTPLTTLIFDFHKVISALTTPLTIPTLAVACENQRLGVLYNFLDLI